MFCVRNAFSSSVKRVLRTSLTSNSSEYNLIRSRSISSDTIRSWSVGKINHVAIAVPDLEKATSLYRDILGANVSKSTPLPEHGVYTVFVELGDTKIELLHPLGENSPIEGFLKRNPAGGIHHICLEVSDIHKAVDSLKGKVRALNPEPKIGAHGKPVVFLHPKDCDGVLVELEQE
ncbi:PREDICTED: methylmalonyl-CoA epimerase, mitochondrial-like [Amphimedon queenslandica]|uniref:Methylmalonyl-CoA epimerase, mitochondrial n=1 Tax=Amphimedon queenslandica TaxID=400682 RepID=A0AAN0I9M8_AMPQE|nr:PREDICTED: methylmalonyl-CoA epimerase, mitochondrial-like [Amphimedon queenslandica]|eukprot:XP_003383303.1 PREDICTED: methylmalonyl-CoA epimerase, mitochondrial-like [Amphimedon queenslandica]